MAKRTGPLLRFGDLTQSEHAFLAIEFVRNSRMFSNSDRRSLESCYAETLHSWGVMCVHPRSHRLYSGSYRSDFDVSFEESTWFTRAVVVGAILNTPLPTI